jgi:hypothetical protein
MQGFELSPKIQPSDSFQSPLDSTTNYSKTRSPNNKRTVRKKAYQEQTFTLRIPLRIDDDDRFEMECLSLLSFLDEVLLISPP